MTSLTPQTNVHSGAAVPGAPVVPARRRFFHRKNKSESSNTNLKPRILSYRPSSKKTSDKSIPQKNEAAESPIQSVQAASPQSDLRVSSETLNNSPKEDTSEDPQKSSTFPAESPLKRPDASCVSPEPVEQRLERPSDDGEEIAFSDIVATFAVDVSGSTEGKVLEEEKDAIKTLCTGLSRDARTQADIIPWSHFVQPTVRLSELESLESSGGTNPSRLNSSPGAKTALSKCSAWFLLTDGQIDPEEVRNFSQGICGAGLHGAPCVIVLFGYKTSRPISCNISVGLSVFSNAADCLFLFHDIDTTQIYILQSKGKFNAVLPLASRELILDQRTLWTDLPQFGYSQLFDLPLPKRQELRQDDLLLQGRQKVNLQDLYQHRIDNSAARKILENDDNLKSVLLAAQLRGDDDNIRHWLSEQRFVKRDVLQSDRPDANYRAAQSMEKLLHALVRQDQNATIPSLQSALRTAHYANWSEFLSTLVTEHDRLSARGTIVSDAMTRISSNRSEMDRGTNSPRMLSPVSPGPSGNQIGRVHNQYFGSMPRAPRSSNRLLFDNKATGLLYNGAMLNASHQCTNLPELAAMKSRLDRDNAGILYIKEYMYRWEPSNIGFEGTCSVCEERNVLLTILLKTPPEGLSTTGFPGPSERKGLAFPLAMGSFPEADILSPYVCCDSCAYTMIRGKLLLNDDRITTAIPLMPAAFSGEFQQTTFALIDAALQKRFHKSVVVLVFLSIIYNTLTNLDGDESRLRSKAFKNLLHWMAANAKLPPGLSMPITGSPPQSGSLGDPLPLFGVLAKSFIGVRDPDSPLLQYPIGGFVVLISIATTFPEAFDKEIIKLAMWHRFLFHLVEKHCSFIAGGPVQAVVALEGLFKKTSDSSGVELIDAAPMVAAGLAKDSKPPARPSDSPLDTSIATQPQARHSICPGLLCETHLLSEEDLEEFQSLDDLFEPVENNCSLALETFLKGLEKEMPRGMLAVDIFDTMRARDDLQVAFAVPHAP